VLFYLDKDLKNAYSEITLKGKGAFPRLTFDRREIILPVVPLEVESKCVFRIINDGYENLSLSYSIPNNVTNIPISLEFPEGMNLGVTKGKLKVEAIFRSAKPISFTLEIHFRDDRNLIYPIKISGTADNCLFTNYPYIQRNFNEYRIIAEDYQPIRIDDLTDDDLDSHRGPTSIGFSAKTGSSSKLAKGMLGYSPIQPHMIEKACQGIVDWMNYNCLVSYINRYP